LASVAGVNDLPASAAGELQVSARSVSVDAANNLQLLAKVTDQNGRPVTGLPAGSFSLNVGGRDFSAANVQSVVDAQVPISSLLVIDTSGSMVGSPLNDARQAASQYVGAQNQIDSVAVVAFANDLQTVSDYSQDFTAVQKTLGTLTASGNTALFDAVVAAADSISKREGARRVVILLSDGENFGPGKTTREQAISAAKGSGVPFYVVGLGPSIDLRFLQELSDSTGGAVYTAPTGAQLASLFSQIAELLRSEYLVTLALGGTGLHGETQATFAVHASGVSGEATINFQLSPAVQQPTTPTLTEQPAASKGGNSSLLLWVVIVLLAGVLVVGLGSFAKHWSDQRVRAYRPAVQPPDAPSPRTEAAESLRISPPARLRFDSGEEIEFAGLATLGVDTGCTLRLPISTSDFGHGEVRIWFANQRYLIRDVSPRSRVKVNGRPVGWSILGTGDEIEIRGVKLRFISESISSASRY
jgi:VWFA-related protein